MMQGRPALGKGLSALIPDAPEPVRQGPLEIDIDLLAPNEAQPRLQMDDGRLEELAQSIRANGIIQPILVRRGESGYRIIAGERRWRAAQRHAAREVISRGLSVRDTELLVKKLGAQNSAGNRTENGKNQEPGTGNVEQRDVHTRAAEDRMRFALGTKVRVTRRGQGGTIEIEFGSEAELNRIYEYITEKRT